MEEITTNDVLSWNIEQLYAYMTILEEELENQDKLLFAQTKQGIMLQVPIEYIIKGYYEEFPSSKTTIIKGYGRVNIQTWFDEIEKRKSILRKIIYNKLSKKDTIEGREAP